MKTPIFFCQCHFLVFFFQDLRGGQGPRRLWRAPPGEVHLTAGWVVLRNFKIQTSTCSGFPYESLFVAFFCTYAAVVEGEPRMKLRPRCTFCFERFFSYSSLRGSCACVLCTIRCFQISPFFKIHYLLLGCSQGINGVSLPGEFKCNFALCSLYSFRRFCAQPIFIIIIFLFLDPTKYESRAAESWQSMLHRLRVQTLQSYNNILGWLNNWT